MLINILGISAVLILAVVGYFRGLFSILATFVAFLLAALFAKPASYLILWLIKLSGVVPLALAPIAAQFSAGLVLFTIFSYIFGRLLRHREHVRQQMNLPRKATWELPGGAVLGAVWGTFLVVLVLTGLHLIGSVKQAMVQPAAENAGSGNRRAEYANSIANFDFENLKEQIEASAFGPLTKEVDPVDEKIHETFVKLRRVINDPYLLGLFKNHPTIDRLMGNYQLRVLAADPDIQAQLRASRYYDLLNDVRIAALLNNEELYNELKDVNLGDILQTIIDENDNS